MIFFEFLEKSYRYIGNHRSSMIHSSSFLVLLLGTDIDSNHQCNDRFDWGCHRTKP